MPTTLEREHQLQDEIAPRVEHDVPGVDVLAVELLAPSRFRVYVDHPEGVDHALCARVTDVLRDYLREYSVEVSSPGSTARCAGKSTSRRPAVAGCAPHHRPEAARGGPLRRAESVKVAASDGAETDIPYDEIVRANLIPIEGSVT